ncbi:coiled-coil domain-containing protein 43 isoform X2 [Nematostella vectensis]|uniref:coiled-coil domain-containing protein 43 isoform X2 n=1 Tax=Nematostella vectensis TaxID=45351 RepID=UPI00138FEA71|nr:coiled-coil domain-containing protein 43 isoform X2 [Nematostella vectensis]
MAAAMMNGSQEKGDFEGWLCSKLSAIGLDEDVFGSYVTGVLDADDSTEDDRKDALIGILDGMTEYPVEELSSEILQHWHTSRASLLKKRQDAKELEVEEKKNKLAQIMEKQAASKSASKPVGAVDAQLKQQLLAKYSHESDEDENSSDEDEAAPVYVTPRLTGNESDLFKNTNAQSVTDKEKEKRDKLKQENDAKKQQIKDAKEKQKQKAEERKEKEKKRTQKGERRIR